MFNSFGKNHDKNVKNKTIKNKLNILPFVDLFKQTILKKLDYKLKLIKRLIILMAFIIIQSCSNSIKPKINNSSGSNSDIFNSNKIYEDIVEIEEVDTKQDGIKYSKTEVNLIKCKNEEAADIIDNEKVNNNQVSKILENSDESEIQDQEERKKSEPDIENNDFLIWEDPKENIISNIVSDIPIFSDKINIEEVINPQEDINIENSSKEVQADITEESEDNNKLILISEYLSGNWRVDDTNEIINSLNKYFENIKSKIDTSFNYKDIKYKNLYIYVDDTQKKTSVVIKDLAKILQCSIKIMKKTIKKLVLNLDNHVVYKKNVYLFNYILDGVKAIASSCKCANTKNWHIELIDTTIGIVHSAAKSARDIQRLYNEISNLNQNDIIVYEKEIKIDLGFASYMETAKIREEQLHQSIENFVIYMNGRDPKDKNNTSKKIERSKKEIDNGVIAIQGIVNIANLEFMISKYVAAGAIRVDNLKQKEKKDILINFIKIKETYQKILQLKNDIMKIHNVENKNKKSVFWAFKKKFS